MNRIKVDGYGKVKKNDFERYLEDREPEDINMPFRQWILDHHFREKPYRKKGIKKSEKP
jgi:hypothetical protein